jgi:hypothetical protein
MITDDSDFFLLGGNPLLLGKLSYFIRKAAGANFTNSTIKGIASLIEVEDGQIPQKGLCRRTVRMVEMIHIPLSATIMI